MLKAKTEISLVLLLVVMLLSLLAVAPNPSLARGSDIADRVAEVEDGLVRMTFEARDGVCGDGDSFSFISTNGSTINFGRSRHWSDDWEDDCDDGPVRVTLRVQDGEVVDLKTRVGGRWRPSDKKILDLGEVSPPAAADYLLDLARHARESVAEDAILPATLARNVEVWPDLLEIARDRSLFEDVRQSAVFWLGQIAGEKACEGLSSLVDDNDVELEVRKTAVFALSQRHDRRSTRYLVEIARTSPHPQLRKNAMFWLAQQSGPDVLDFFEEMLLED